MKCAGAVLAVAVLAGAAWGQGTITWLPAYPGVVAPGQGSGHPTSMTPDGSVVVGSFWSTATGQQFHAFRWSGTSGMQALPSTLGGPRWEPYGVAPDGTAVGYAQVDVSEWHAARWPVGGSMIDMGMLPGGHYSEARASSAQGTIVGASNTPSGSRGFRWTAAGGMVPLAPVPGLSTSAALCVSADETTVGGGSGPPPGSTWSATIWVGGVPQNLGVLPGDLYADVRFLSADGTVAVGESGPANVVSMPGRKAFRWTAATGMRFLFDIPVGYGVTTASDDGSVVLCGMIWTEARGLRAAPDVLAEYGIVMSGYASLVSPDGRRLAGSGVYNGEGRAWVATIPAGLGCYANCDGSTASPLLNIADFTCFLQRFAAGEAYANCDQSTAPPVLNVADFTCFLRRFAAGCP